MSTNKNYIQV